MSAARLIKMAPTAALAVYLAYSAFSFQSALPGAAESKAALEKGLDVMIRDLVVDGGTGIAEKVKEVRNPFLVVTPRAPAPTASETDEAAAPEADLLAERIAGLSLDATFVQRGDQLAIINGRIYSRGQNLALPGDEGKSLPPVVVLFVKPTGVILRGGSKNYLLGYPEKLGKKRDAGAEVVATEADSAMLDPSGQAAMFQRLLNSPLGKMGKGLIGDAVPSRSGRGSRPGARAKKGTARPSAP